eukprot:scpid80416/ scgid9125/ 
MLTCQDPRKLSFFVWYTVTTHFCLRGGELQAKLKKSDLVLTVVEGKESFHLATDFMTKNHRGGLDGTTFASNGCINDDVQVNTIKKISAFSTPNVIGFSIEPERTQVR